MGAKNFILTGLVIALTFLIAGDVNAYSDKGGYFSCENCSDCINALNDNKYNEVRLNASITNQNETCINNPTNFTNKIFDCQGHVIDGNLTEGTHGIYLSDKQNNTIKNCIITNFEDGIYLAFSSNISLMNSTIRSNWNGIYMFGSSNNNLILNNTFLNNGLTGISIADFYGSADVKSCINETQGANASNASNNSNILNETNPSEIGAKVTACIKDGKIVACTKNATNETRMCEKIPAMGPGNTNNTFKDNIILDNRIGIYSKSSNSTINTNVLNNKIYDLYSDNWESSSGDNNTCFKTERWKDNNTQGCKILFISEEFDYDNNGIIDTFDAVAGLDYLSEGKEIYYDSTKIGGLDLLFDIFALIEEIVIEG